MNKVTKALIFILILALFGVAEYVVLDKTVFNKKAEENKTTAESTTVPTNTIETNTLPTTTIGDYNNTLNPYTPVTTGIVGKYELAEMSEGTLSYTGEQIKALGMSITMELKADKTGVIDLMGETENLTYDDTYITVDGDKTPYTFENNRITLQEDDTKMVFQKAY